MNLLAKVMAVCVLLTGLSACSDGGSEPAPSNSSELPTFDVPNVGEPNVDVSNIDDTNVVVQSDDGNAQLNPDGDGSQNLEPLASADAVAGILGEELMLNGSASTDPDGDNLTFSWQLVSSPPGSTFFDLPDSNTPTFSFTPDARGEFVIRLTVSDPDGASSAIDVTATVTIPTTNLSYRPIDAEYSKSLDRIVLVSSVPNQVHILNAETLEEQTISLNLVPTSVSVSPDGLQAAVGHDGWVSYVSLSDASLIDTMQVSLNVGDVVLGGNRHIYVFPYSTNFTDDTAASINIDTKAQSKPEGNFFISAAIKAKLQPNSNFIYGAENDSITPADIHKLSISDEGTISWLYDSPYHGDYEMCGDLWFSEDGQRIFTKCANVFRATENRESDMIYNGSFNDVARIEHLSHSAAVNEIAMIPGDDWWVDNPDANTEIKLFDYEFLGFKSTISIPQTIVGGRAFSSFGEYIFYAADGNSLYALIRVDPDSALLNDYSIWKVVE